MSRQKGEKINDLEKIIEEAEKNNRKWLPAQESHNDVNGRKTNDQIVSNTFKPPLPDDGDKTRKKD